MRWKKKPLAARVFATGLNRRHSFHLFEIVSQ